MLKVATSQVQSNRNIYFVLNDVICDRVRLFSVSFSPFCLPLYLVLFRKRVSILVNGDINAVYCISAILIRLYTAKKTPKKQKQECIPVGCVLTAAVAAIRCHYWGVCPTPLLPPEADPPLNAETNPPWMQTPFSLDADPLYPGCRPPPPVNRRTQASENITFPCGRYKNGATFHTKSKIAFYCNATHLSHGGIFEGRVNETVFIFAFA